MPLVKGATISKNIYILKQSANSFESFQRLHKKRWIKKVKI
jgi:hypothetical protein